MQILLQVSMQAPPEWHARATIIYQQEQGEDTISRAEFLLSCPRGAMILE